MFLKSLAAAAAGFAAASALLLVPDVATTNSQGISTLSIAAPSIGDTHIVDIECPDCPFGVRGRQGMLRTMVAIPNRLRFNFTIRHDETHDSLLLNGREIFPEATMTMSAPQLPTFARKAEGGPEAPQMPRNFEPQEAKLNFRVELRSEGDTQGIGMELIEGNFQVVFVNERAIDGLQSINFKMTRNTKLSLAFVEIAPADPVDLGTPAYAGEDCRRSILCRWRALMAEKLGRTKGHHCSKAGKTGQHEADDKPHHGKHRHGHHPHLELHEHSWMQLLQSVKSHVVSPVLVGIAAGISAGLLIMFFRRYIVRFLKFISPVETYYLVGRSRRHHRRRHGHGHHRASRREFALADEKCGLMAETVVPPAYTDAETDTEDVQAAAEA